MYHFIRKSSAAAAAALLGAALLTAAPASAETRWHACATRGTVDSCFAASEYYSDLFVQDEDAHQHDHGCKNLLNGALSISTAAMKSHLDVTYYDFAFQDLKLFDDACKSDEYQTRSAILRKMLRASVQ
jgi:hypothetical protein